MSDPNSELSSISSALTELTERISKLADLANVNGQDDLAHDLFDVERALMAGARRLQKIVLR